VRATELEADRLVLRPVEAADVERLAAIRSTPEVARWWQARTSDEVRSEWEKALADGEAQWAVWLDREIIGFAQAYEETDDDYRHAGIDLFIDPLHHHEGLGREVTRRVAQFLFEDEGHHRIVIDPALANERAIRCYESVGFTRVGIMRQCWFDHVERRWADGLLMDLLAKDLGGTG
jgi:aminoglycoside 6'-N-acetyltransferase